jgi:hypothetical protein
MLAQVRDLLNECRDRHARLHVDLIDAPERVLEAQLRLFQLREQSRIPSLEAEILEPLLAQPLGALSELGDELTAALCPPRVFHLFDPITLTEHIADIREPEFDEAERALLNPGYESTEELSRFSPQCQQRMKEYLQSTVRRRPGIRFSELLELAERDGHAALERRCLAYLVIYAFCPESSQYALEAVREGGFEHDWIAGVELTLSPAEALARPAGETTDKEPVHEHP